MSLAGPRLYTARMADILKQIVAYKRGEVAAARAAVPLAELVARCGDLPPPRNFFTAVTRPSGELRVIAEVKKASPSAGVIRRDFDPAGIARSYHQAGAAAISCLTDEHFFQGKLAYLAQIRDAVPLPVLRKDFLIDPYQVYEARAAGADAVLLIAECLDEPLLVDMLILATELKLTKLVEVHDVEQLMIVQRHLDFPHPMDTLLGINNRNLKTMTVDLGHTLRLLSLVDNPDRVVSESGIRTPADVSRLRAAGVNRILVGESLMRQPDPGAALKHLMGTA